MNNRNEIYVIVIIVCFIAVFFGSAMLLCGINL
jgi:hypothetical protein